MIDTVSRRGYSGVTINALVRGAGMSKSTFYQHFGSKEECFLAAVDEIMRVVVAWMTGAFGSGDDVRAGTEAATRAMVEGAVAHPDAARLFVVNTTELGEGSIEARMRIATTLEAMAEGALSQGH